MEAAINNPALKILCAALCLALAAVSRAGPQSSADYLFTTEFTDDGGQRTASVDYRNDSSLGAGSFTASADYNQRGGYIGQLNNAPVATNYTFTVISNSTIKVPISALLSTATDVDGDSFPS
jgi:hypothetical protein